jgi:hypothetical protein
MMFVQYAADPAPETYVNKINILRYKFGWRGARKNEFVATLSPRVENGRASRTPLL